MKCLFQCSHNQVKPISRVYVVFDGIATTQLPCVVDWKHQFYNDHSYVGMWFYVCEFSVDVSLIKLNFMIDLDNSLTIWWFLLLVGDFWFCVASSWPTYEAWNEKCVEAISSLYLIVALQCT